LVRISPGQTPPYEDIAMNAFRIGHATGDHWEDVADACLAQIGAVPAGANLGFLYVTDPLSEDLALILEHLMGETGVQHWVGTVGIGICATGVEYYEEPAAAVMLGEFPEGSFRVFSDGVLEPAAFAAEHGVWLGEHRPYLALVHADPAQSDVEDKLGALAMQTSSGFLVGGLASARETVGFCADGVTRGGISGVLFGEQVPIITRLSQGCSPIGPQHEVTAVQRNILIEIDQRPALDVLKEDIGPALSEDLTRIGGLIFAGLPIPGSDTGDYLVRNLVGLDPERGLLAIGEQVGEGERIMFCRRDRASAREDMVRMLQAIAKGLSGPPRGGIYVSCLGRGANLFGADSAELKLIRAELGDFPLVGFYANGEISQDRLYGYTGVLTLFS
jgi:small ligand-binding sensory domain FIST